MSFYEVNYEEKLNEELDDYAILSEADLVVPGEDHVPMLTSYLEEEPASVQESPVEEPEPIPGKLLQKVAPDRDEQCVSAEHILEEIGIAALDLVQQLIPNLRLYEWQLLIAAVALSLSLIAFVIPERTSAPCESAFFKEMMLSGISASRPEHAVSFFEKAISKDPHCVSAYEWLARAQFDQNHWRLAFNTANKALEIDRLSLNARMIKGKVFATRRELSNALDQFVMVTILDPNHAEAMYWKGRMLVDIDSLGLAFDSLDKATSLNPVMKDARFLKGRLAFARNEFETALKEFEYLIRSENTPEEHQEYVKWKRQIAQAKLLQ